MRYSETWFSSEQVQLDWMISKAFSNQRILWFVGVDQEMIGQFSGLHNRPLHHMTSLRSSDPLPPTFHLNLNLLCYASIPSGETTSTGNNFSFPPPKKLTGRKMHKTRRRSATDLPQHFDKIAQTGVGQTPNCRGHITSGEGMCEMSLLHGFLEACHCCKNCVMPKSKATRGRVRRCTASI